MKTEFTKLWKILGDHFSLGPQSLHGPSHWRQVECNGLRLAHWTGADETIVRLFAVFHDSCRENEGSDPDHGRRASSLIREYQGELFRLESAQLELLCFACEWHNDGQVTDDVIVGTCWDADRMDLPRVGMDIDPDYMSTRPGQEFARRGHAAFGGPQAHRRISIDQRNKSPQ